MAETFATSVVFVFYGYVIAGILFALIFGWRGVDLVDHQAKGSGFAFRLLIFPGCVAFWPLLLRRWLRATGEPPPGKKPSPMIQPLRKSHWRIVLGLSVLLPILFFAGLRARHPKLTGKAAKETRSAGAQNAPEHSARQVARQGIDR